MAIRVAINGFGRIGRTVARVIAADPASDVELCAINDLGDRASLAYLLEFDSVHGRSASPVAIVGDEVHFGSQRMKTLAERDPSRLPWRELGVDVVLECTGRFRTRATASAHLEAGAGRVIISAPPSDPVDGVFVIGVNDADFDPDRHRVISNASCTTNCLAPQLAALGESFGIRKGHMLTVHAYTNDQSLIDEPHPTDPRRGRAAALSMIPTTSGVTKALFEILPQLRGKLEGSSVRVPTPDVSMTCLSILLDRPATAAEVNDAFRAAAQQRLRGVLAVEDRPLVSMDYAGSPYSAVIDSSLTSVIDGDLVEVTAWYDNEWGFSHRMVDLARRVGRA